MRRNSFAIKTLFTKMERYLIQNNKARVLAGSCNTTTSESDLVGPWDEYVDWND